ncbi:MAG: Mu transposase C-terminal domain-containing protein [Solirubrobacterales bacterium]|nr:Mu transposase C-terminal domain-containing protein [Solirubrobacterales bacterium]
MHRYGVSHAGHRYISADLHDLVGERVEIAFAPHDQRRVEVYCARGVGLYRGSARDAERGAAAGGDRRATPIRKGAAAPSTRSHACRTRAARADDEQRSPAGGGATSPSE